MAPTTYHHAILRERQGAGVALARLMGHSGNKMETWIPEKGIRIRQNEPQAVDVENNGEVAERLNAPVLKTGNGKPFASSNLALSAKDECWL
jgi:hypothetical protein